MNLREIIKNHPVIIYVGALLAGFIAGWIAYDSVLKTSKLEVISSTELANLKIKIAELEEIINNLTKKHRRYNDDHSNEKEYSKEKFSLIKGSSKEFPNLNLTIKLKETSIVDEGYKPYNRATIIYDQFIKEEVTKRAKEEDILPFMIDNEIYFLKVIEIKPQEDTVSFEFFKNKQ